MTADIADEVEKLTGSPAVAVLGHGEHPCMTMRGVRAAATFSTTAWRGRFGEDFLLRAEFLGIAGAPRGR